MNRQTETIEVVSHQNYLFKVRESTVAMDPHKPVTAVIWFVSDTQWREIIPDFCCSDFQIATMILILLAE